MNSKAAGHSPALLPAAESWPKTGLGLSSRRRSLGMPQFLRARRLFAAIAPRYEPVAGRSLPRAKLDARRHLPAPLLDVFAAVLLDHEYFFACGRDRQVGGKPASSPSVRAVSVLSNRASSSPALRRPTTRSVSTTRLRSSSDACKSGRASDMAARAAPARCGVSPVRQDMSVHQVPA
jgi:hypothetical protein